MRCETTSSVKECALRARSTHGVHHAIVEVNIVIGVVLGEVLVARVVPLVVDAVIGLALSLIAHVVVVGFRPQPYCIEFFCMGDILFTHHGTTLIHSARHHGHLVRNLEDPLLELHERALHGNQLQASPV